MRTGKPLWISIAVGIAVLLLVIAMALSAISWNFARPWIAQKVSAATGRSFAINGDLRLSWQRPNDEHAGWQRLLPWPHLRAKDLVLGNPDWATTGPTMAKLPQLDFTLNPVLLLKKTLSISSLVLTEPDLVLEVGKNGKANWHFKQDDADKKPSSWQLQLHDLSLNRGTVRLVDPVKKADVTTRIDTEKDGSVVWNIGGKLDQDKVSGKGKAGALLSLQGRDTKYPVDAALKIGETDITAHGTLTDPRHLRALDVQLKILGASMGQLFPFTGIVLPETPHFSTEGRVVGSLAADDFHMRYEKFTGKVGHSDIAGTLEYRGAKPQDKQPRALLRGDVVSNYLDLKDLGALVGSNPAKEEKKAADTPKQPPGKVLPVAPFRTERWRKLDADVSFAGKKIIRSTDLPVEDLQTHIRLQDGTLALTPLNFGVAGGKFTTDLTIEGKSEPAKARLTIRARDLKLSKLFPKVESMHASLGEIHGNANLSAVGNSLAALAASANGEVKAFISQGTVSKFILEAMGLNIGSVIVTELFGDRQVQLNCLASDFAVNNGVMQARTFVVDTEDALITVDGSIDLAKEALALTIHPESKGVRLISLRSPLHVEGSFKHPDIGVDKGVVALKAGAATVLGAVATPFAALLALINPGPDEPSPCASLLAKAKEKPTAPPPGKTKTKGKAKVAAKSSPAK